VQELWTADEFIDWLQPGIHADLIWGQRHMHSPVNLRHADLLNFLDALLRQHIEANDLGKLYQEVVAVRLSERNVFLPDLAFFSNDQLSYLQKAHAATAPKMVVEAISPWSADRDAGLKFAAYEEYGVYEYWLLDPERLKHRFFKRDGSLLKEFAQTGEKIISTAVSGFWVRRSWLDPAKLPKVRDCLAELLA
jgi:Uma2 family endonuclease